jgi:hypothetical protein
LFTWSPSYAQLQGLEKGLTETIHWFQNSSNLASYKSEIYNI